MQYEHAKMLGGTSSPTPAFYALELKAVMCKNGLIGSDESIIVFSHPIMLSSNSRDLYQ